MASEPDVESEAAPVRSHHNTNSTYLRGADIMTYTIMGYDPKTKQIGCASATCTINCTRFHMPIQRGLLPAYSPTGGLLMPQASSSYIVPFKLLDLMEKGASFSELHEEAKKDSNYLISQIGLVRSNGELWVYTGKDCKDVKRHIQGPDYIVMGNAIASDAVFEAMAAAFEASRGKKLHERLMRSIEAGRDAGGQKDPKYGHLPELWALVWVFDGTEKPLVDLRVDYDVEGVAKLRQLVDDITPLQEFYDIMVYDTEKFSGLWNSEDKNLEMKLYWRDLAAKKGK